MTISKDRTRSFTIIAIGIWFAAAFVAGNLGWVNEPGRPPLVLLSFLVVPIAAFLIAYSASAGFRVNANSISLTLLVGSHVWRFIGVFFIIAALTGLMPMGFGIPAGIGDVIAATGALLLIPKLRQGTASRRWLLIWNWFGVLDLLSAIAMGVLYSNASTGVLASGTVTTQLMVTFPFSVIPTFFVPLFLLIHLLLFERLAHPQREAALVGGSASPPTPGPRPRGSGAGVRSQDVSHKADFVGSSPRLLSIGLSP